MHFIYDFFYLLLMYVNSTVMSTLFICELYKTVFTWTQQYFCMYPCIQAYVVVTMVTDKLKQ